jgi:hypothetical protein
MKKLICVASLLGGSLLPLISPAVAQVVVKKRGHTFVYTVAVGVPGRSEMPLSLRRGPLPQALSSVEVEGSAPVLSLVAPHSHLDAIG